MNDPEVKAIHIPVMVSEVVELLNLREGLVVVDGTIGEGGHGLALLEKIGTNSLLVGIDRDGTLLEKARRRFLARNIAEDRFLLVCGSYSEIGEILSTHRIEGADRIFLDLGFSSAQVESDRGFGFSHDSRLDMRYNAGEGESAADVVNRLPVEELQRIIRQYGEERWAGRIARELARSRQDKAIETTSQLAEIARNAVPRSKWRPGRHPATKMFQALRIYVNRELELLEEGIAACLKVLRRHGRLGIISYHSLEDRIVKHAFRDAARLCTCPPSQPVCTCGRKRRFVVITKSPVVAKEQEVRSNRRARSAKLRVVENVEL